MFQNFWIPQLIIALFQNCISNNIIAYPTIIKQNSQSQQFNLSNSIADSQFAFGIWSQCVPQFQGDFQVYTPNIENSVLDIQKQFLFLLKNNPLNQVLLMNIAEFKIEQQQVVNKLILNERFFNISEISQEFNSLEFEGKWIFILFYFDGKNAELTISLNEKQQKRISFTQNIKEITVVIGGLSQIENIHLNLNYLYSYFMGRLCTPCILNSSNTHEQGYENLKQKCIFPEMQIRANEVLYIISELAQINENTKYLNTKIIFQNGDGYAFSGWVKNFQTMYEFETSIFLFKITTNNFYSKIQFEGDALLKFNYLINSNQKNKTSILISADFHKIPIFDQIGKYSKRIEKKIISNESELIYNGIHEWHYFYYQFNKKSNSAKGMLEIHFINEQEVYQTEISDSYYRGSFLNSNFVFYVIEDIFPNYRFKGQLYQLAFINNFQNQTFNEFLKCHFKCMSCNGPLENNCLTCKLNSNRVYLKETNQCICQESYIENQINSNCVKPFHIKTQTLLLENQISGFCDFGYYKKPDSFSQFNCYKCPQTSKVDFYCVECLTNPNNWYLLPYCASRLSQKYQRLDSSYTLYQFYDGNYIINKDFDLLFKPEIYEICQDKEDKYLYCQQLNYTHLNQPIYANIIKDYFDIQFQQLVYQYGCIMGYLMKFKCYNCFREGCLVCQFQLGVYFHCIKCQIGYLLHQFNDKCLRCGLNCDVCDFTYDLNDKRLICKVCKNNYFISTDRVNCLKNDIVNCSIVIQASSEYEYRNDLQMLYSLNFTSYSQYCLQCQVFHVFVFQTSKCIRMTNEVCFQGYADMLIQKQINDWNFLRDEEFQYYTSQIQCLVVNQKAINLQVQDQCRKLFENCLFCTYTFYNLEQINKIICIQCLKGYYWSIIQDNCVQCEENQEHLVCQFQTLILENFDSTTDYLSINSQPREQCDETCQKCENNVCLICKQMSEKGRNQISIDGVCIQCPYNCAVCLQRSKIQIDQINPLFQNKKFMFYSNICFASYRDREYYFDRELRTFVQCEDHKLGCQTSYQINLNLYCSTQDYFTDLEQIEEQEQHLFKKQNILFEQLNQLSEIFEDEFYEQGNKDNVRIIELIITSSKPQVCRSSVPLIFQNEFSSNIFSALNVSLIFKFEYSMIFELERNLSFINFISIQIQGLQLKFLENFIPKLIIFQSNFQQQIKLNKINFTLEYKSNSQILISINKFDLFSANIIHLESQFIQNNFLFLSIQQEQQQKQSIYLEHFLFENLNCNNWTFLQLKQNQQHEINIQDIVIFKCKFSNFLFIDIIDICFQSLEYCDLREYKVGIFLLNSYKFEQVVFDGGSFKSIFYLNNFLFSCIRNIIIDYCSFQNTKIFQIGQNSSLQNFSITNSKFYSQFMLILNEQTFESHFQYLLNNFTLFNNEYSKQSKFISLQQFNSYTSICKINNLLIENNVLTYQETINDIYSLNLTLVYLSAQIVEITNLSILRSFGINPISLAYIFQLTFINTTIIQSKDFQYLKLHDYFYCLKLNESQKNLVTSIQMFSITQVKFQNLSINQTQSLNHPIILYQSASPKKETQLEIIIFEKIFIKQNLFIVEDEESFAGVININTDQISQISIIDSEFRENILHHYQETLKQYGSIISIQAPNSKCKIKNSNFFKNIVQNSTNNINYFQCQEIVLRDCDFENNNAFSYDLIQQYIIWDFMDNSLIFLEDIQDKFRVKSLTGNGIFIFNSISINNINISYSQGTQSAAITLIAQKVSEILIENVNLFQLEIIYDSDFQLIGAIYIDCTESLSLQIKIIKIRAQNFFSYGQGGLFHIESGKNQADIIFVEIEAQDQFSKLGSLIYILFSQNIKSKQSLKIVNATSYCTQSGWDYFNQIYLRRWSLEREFLLSVSNNVTLIDRYQIYVQFGYFIELNNLILYGFIQESAIYLQNITKVILHQTKIFSCYIQQQLINIQFSSTYFAAIQTNIKQSLQISQFQISKIQQISSALNIYFEFNVKQKLMICSLKVTEAPSYFEVYDKSTILITKELTMTRQSGILVIQCQQSQFFRSKITQIQFNNINCSQCFNGLLQMQFHKNSNFHQTLLNILIQNSNCGKLGCLNIISSQSLLENIGQYQNLTPEFQLYIKNYICKNNIATNGTCLNFQNVDIQVYSSYFISNNASFAGGAIYVNSNSQLFIENSIISQNSAILGGGVYLNKYYPLLYDKLKVQITQNQAFYSGQDVFSSSEKLLISFGDVSKAISLLAQSQTSQNFIEEYGLKEQFSIFGIETHILFYPNGQNISKYKYFDWKNRKYILPNLNFRLQAITNKGAIVNELEKSFCIIESRPTIKSTLEFFNNYTNFEIVYYDEITNDFNLDNLAIYFENGQEIELQFNCSCVKVPIYNQTYPYNIINYLDYILRIKFKPLQCQLGEIINQNLKSCDICDSDQGFFNLQLNQNQCKMRDDLSTISVTPAQLELRKYYWRPYFDSYQVAYCINNPSNCKGGWIEGDSSCIEGHLGALCEQCDIYNIRGDGKFSRESQYLCNSCQGNAQNIIIISFLFIETLVSILIAAQSNFQSIKEQLLIIRMKLIGLRVIQKINQRAILIKILTNYLQIISYVTTFQLQFSFDFDSIVNFAANPTKQLTYTLSCWLSNNFSLQIHYLNMICQLLLPFCYITIFFAVYFIGNLAQHLNYNKSLITATLIYIYIYFQPTLIANLVLLVSYRKISGFQWITANVAYRYDTKIHYSWILQLFLPTFFCLFFCIPLIFLYALLKNNRNLDSKEIRLKWGYLYSEYNSNAYLWEILKIVQKELLIVFLSYFEDNINLKSVFASLILLTYLEFNIIYKPYFSSQLNNLDFQSANVCFSSIILALSINYCQQHSIQFFSIFFSYVLIILNIQFIFAIVRNIIFQFFNRKTYESSNNFKSLNQSLLKYFPQIQKISCCQRFLSNNRSIEESRKQDLFRKLKRFVQSISKQQTRDLEYNLKFKMLRMMNQSEHQNKLNQFE